MNTDSGDPGVFSQFANREQVEDQALAMHSAGVGYVAIAQRLAIRGGPGVAYRYVQAALKRRLPNEADAHRLAELDAAVLRLKDRLVARDPDAALELRNLMQERLAILAPGREALPLPEINRDQRERDRELQKLLRRVNREQSALLASIQASEVQARPYKELLAEIDAELGLPRRPPGRPRRKRR